MQRKEATLAQRQEYNYLYNGHEADEDYEPPLSCDAEGAGNMSPARVLDSYRSHCDCSQEAQVCQGCLKQCQDYLMACGRGPLDCINGCLKCVGRATEDGCKDRKCTRNCPGRAGGHYHGSAAGELFGQCLAQTCLICLQAALCPGAPHHHHRR